MKTKTYRTCRVTKWGEEYSNCELRFETNKYILIILKDSENLFVDFNLEIDSNELPEIAINRFENECINRFTCQGEFSMEQIKENSGEEISFN